MPIACNPEALAAASVCYNCIPEDLWRAEMLYLANVISGLNLTPEQLAARSVCYMCIPEDLWRAEMTLLYCTAANRG
jgi:hypothetical protein